MGGGLIDPCLLPVTAPHGPLLDEPTSLLARIALLSNLEIDQRYMHRSDLRPVSRPIIFQAVRTHLPTPRGSFSRSAKKTSHSPVPRPREYSSPSPAQAAKWVRRPGPIAREALSGREPGISELGAIYRIVRTEKDKMPASDGRARASGNLYGILEVA